MEYQEEDRIVIAAIASPGDVILEIGSQSISQFLSLSGSLMPFIKGIEQYKTCIRESKAIYFPTKPHTHINPAIRRGFFVAPVSKLHLLGFGGFETLPGRPIHRGGLTSNNQDESPLFRRTVFSLACSLADNILRIRPGIQIR